MVMLDTNMVLRYLLNDNENMATEAEHVIQQENAYVTIEILAEVVYVLKGVYSVEREKIKSTLLEFLTEIQISEPEIAKVGLMTYAKHNLDFVDCILYAYNRVKGYEIKTFDKKLIRLLKEENDC